MPTPYLLPLNCGFAEPRIPINEERKKKLRPRLASDEAQYSTYLGYSTLGVEMAMGMVMGTGVPPPGQCIVHGMAMNRSHGCYSSRGIGRKEGRSEGRKEGIRVRVWIRLVAAAFGYAGQNPAKEGDSWEGKRDGLGTRRGAFVRHASGQVTSHYRHGTAQ